MKIWHKEISEMDESKPIGYATLRHQIDLNKPGGHLGCCLKRSAPIAKSEQ